MFRILIHRRYAALIAGLLLMMVSIAEAGSTRPINFVNNTGRVANDLHIEFRQAVDPHPPGGPFGPFAGEKGSGTSKIDFSSGTVNPGAGARIVFRSSSSRIRVKRWWWTLNGKRIGRIMRERHLAMVSFDQDFIRSGEAVSVEAYAAAALGNRSQFIVAYVITDPNGQSFPLPEVVIEVAAGYERNQQLFSTALSAPGEYKLSYTVIDGDTHEVIADGTSTVIVDEGVRELLGEAEANPL